METWTKEGEATWFVGTEPGSGTVADFADTVVGELDGRRVNGEFEQ